MPNIDSRHLVFLTIGQAPRHDMSQAIERELPPDLVIQHAGVLDGLDRAAISRRFASSEGRPWLISQLADGETVTLDAEAIERQLQQCIDAIDHAGTDVIVLLCTGEFPALRTKRAWLVEPDAVVCSSVAGLLNGTQAGIIVPLPQQVAEARAKWQRLETPPHFATASPYSEEPDELLDAAASLQRQGAQALVLDCMGYSPRHKQILKDAGCPLPVLVASSVVAGALNAFL
ncbi:hypothetical protein GCM10011348_21390 [Marinobacterium nitratireducens]|uniref:AroM protein n=1 Tax=Marinobacterium nitratireducens TaxID=518897 RepID=A0A917ZGN7_9GAMM|nr:AroM family protein [Marinobacterium nitratireducens]GGO81729.1 hypothetical protein GCM10011348_21390 [Marinobacterium nitratireducens]